MMWKMMMGKMMMGKMMREIEGATVVGLSWSQLVLEEPEDRHH